MPAQVALEPHETLFETGDSSEGGIYVVVEGALGVFLAGADGGPRHTNSLHPGESVGDLDVLDGAAVECHGPAERTSLSTFCPVHHACCNRSVACWQGAVLTYIRTLVHCISPTSLLIDPGALPSVVEGFGAVRMCRRAAQPDVHGHGGGRAAGADPAAPVPGLHCVAPPHAADLPAKGARPTCMHLVAGLALTCKLHC